MDDSLVIGIDPASAKLAIVALHKEEFAYRTYAKLGPSGGPACHNAARAVGRFVQTSIPASWKSGRLLAFIESPVVGRGGVRSTMVQCFTSGAVQGVLYGLGFHTQIANVSSWKKRVVGKGKDRKSTRLNSSHVSESRMPSSA